LLNQVSLTLSLKKVSPHLLIVLIFFNFSHHQN